MRRVGNTDAGRYPGAMASSLDAPEFELRRHLRAIWQRRKIIAIVVLLLVASTLIASAREEPLYEGGVKVLLQRRATESVFGVQEEVESEDSRRVNNEIEVMKSEPVRAAVRRQLGSHDGVSVAQVGDTDVVEIKGFSSDRQRAAAIARAYALSYIDLRRQQAVNDLTAAVAKTQARIDSLQAQIDALDRRIDEEQQRAFGAAAGSPVRSEPMEGLTAQRNHLLTQQASLRQRVDDLQLDADLRSGGAELVTGSAVSVSQVRPRPVKDGVVALALGLFLGVGLALLLEYLDDSIKTREDVARAAPDLPILAVVPAMRRLKDGPSLPISLLEPHSAVAEAYSGLRTSLQFLSTEPPPQVFQVTSAKAEEGKTSVVSNLGVASSRAGRKVVIVDCDLRRSRLHQFFGVPNEVGFTSVFFGQARLEEALQSAPGADSLSLLTSGPMPADAPEILSARKTAEILAELQSNYDAVLLDCPPVLPVSDAIALSAWVDATILVARAGSSTRRELLRTVEVLAQADAPLVGMVLNAVTAEVGYGYGYRYRERPSAPSGRTVAEAGLRGHRPGRWRRVPAAHEADRVSEPGL